AQFSQLDGVVQGINPKFAAFGHHLYQLISTASEPDEELLDYYKNFIDVVRESQQVEQAIYTLGLPPHNFIGAIRLIVESAAAQGLVVMYGPPETVCPMVKPFLLSKVRCGKLHGSIWIKRKKVNFQLP
ncbi:MAG: hypothetical protein H7Z73_05220, partial [Candidatus Saccharibacteria bacterium]|nr:hypothetical protein [Moraxellaceae bacterium]